MPRANVLSYGSGESAESSEAAEIAGAALAAGLAALVTGIIPVLGLIFAFIAIRRGAQALRLATLDGTRRRAIVGIVLGAGVLGLYTLLLVPIVLGLLGIDP